MIKCRMSGRAHLQTAHGQPWSPGQSILPTLLPALLSHPRALRSPKERAAGPTQGGGKSWMCPPTPPSPFSSDFLQISCLSQAPLRVDPAWHGGQGPPGQHHPFFSLPSPTHRAKASESLRTLLAPPPAPWCDRPRPTAARAPLPLLHAGWFISEYTHKTVPWILHH